MLFHATRGTVKNRGEPPTEFLTELVDWGHGAETEIFAPNPNPADIYATIKPVLGPWTTLFYRRAVMMEVMRVHAGFESSWNWDEGVDVTNQTSLHNRDGEETGIFQVSFDTTLDGNGSMSAFAVEHGIGTVGSFISEMKSNHKLALDYYARLIRISVKWAGPILRHEIDPWLSRAAVQEFMWLLS